MGVGKTNILTILRITSFLMFHGVSNVHEAERDVRRCEPPERSTACIIRTKVLLYYNILISG